MRSALPVGCTVFEGKTTTCEIILGETPDDIKRWAAEGFLGVEMEAALFFAASKYFKIPAASILFVSDNLVEDESFMSSAHQQSYDQREQAKVLQYKIGLKELLTP